MSFVETDFDGLVRAYASTSQTMASGSSTHKVHLDTVDYDPDGSFDPINHKYICPTDGYYFLAGRCAVVGVNAGDAFQVEIIRNGSTTLALGTFAVLGASALSAGFTALTSLATDVRSLNAGDAITLEGNVSGGDTLSTDPGANRTFLTAHRLL